MIWSMTLNTAIVPIFFRAQVHVVSDLRVMPALSKYKHFGLKLCSLILNFGHHSLWNIFFFSNILRSSPARWEPQRMDMSESRGCIATGCLPLSDITKIKCPNDFFQNS
jgi:hypothetical protein